MGRRDGAHEVFLDCLRGRTAPAEGRTPPSRAVGGLDSGSVAACASLSTQPGTRMPCALGTWALAAGAAWPSAAASSTVGDLAPAGAAWGSAWPAGRSASLALLLGWGGAVGDWTSVPLQRSALLCTSSRLALSRPGSWPGAFSEAGAGNSCAHNAGKGVGLRPA